MPLLKLEQISRCSSSSVLVDAQLLNTVPDLGNLDKM